MFIYTVQGYIFSRTPTTGRTPVRFLCKLHEGMLLVMIKFVKYNYYDFFNLSFDGGQNLLVLRGGGVESIPQFLFVKKIEKVIRLYTVVIFNFLNGSFKDMRVISTHNR